MILVTGATGTVGGAVVRRLVARGVRVRALTRTAARGAALGPGVQVAVGDLGDPDTLDAAVRGVDRVFMVFAGLDGPVHDAHLVRAAQRAGVRHLVKLSTLRIDDGADDVISRMHRQGEETVAASGLDFTFVRARAFMSNALGWSTAIRAGRPVSLPFPEATQVCVDPRDVGEVAARALTEDGHAGRVHRLTGPEALTPVQQLERIGAVLGRTVPHTRITPEEARRQMASRWPEPLVDAMLGSAQNLSAGVKDRRHPSVEEVTGRPPRSFAQWAADHADAFRSASDGS